MEGQTPVPVKKLAESLTIFKDAVMEKLRNVSGTVMLY